MTAPSPVEPDALGLYGRTLTREPPDDAHRALQAAEVVDGPRLGDVVTGHADAPDGTRPAVAASAWLNHLATVLVPPVAAAWTLEQVGIDASPSNVELHLDGGLPRRIRLRDPTPAGVGPEDRDAGLETLLGHHLDPLLREIEGETGLPSRVGWGTVGTLLAWMYDRMEATDPAGASIPSDRDRLLGADETPWGREPNPLRDPVDRVAVGGDRVLVRRTCCMKREIPGKGPCHTCPNIDRERREALLEDRDPAGT